MYEAHIYGFATCENYQRACAHASEIGITARKVAFESRAAYLAWLKLQNVDHQTSPYVLLEDVRGRRTPVGGCDAFFTYCPTRECRRFG